MHLTGTWGDDFLTGTDARDSFNLAGGGADTAFGEGGNDTFMMGYTLDANDRIDGGAGNDTIDLDGDYSHGVTFADTTFVNVETIQVEAGFNYKLKTADGNVAGGAELTVDASALGPSNSLSFDGSAETDGWFHLIGGAGNDVLTGGNGNDIFDLGHGGSDTASGGGGDDVFQMGGTLDPHDAIDGGSGSDTLVLDGLGTNSSVTLLAGTLTSIEKIVMHGGYDYSLTAADGNADAGGTLTVDASAVDGGHTVRFDGTAERAGSFDFKTGTGTYRLAGGTRADTFDLGSTFRSGDSIDGGSSTGHTAVNGDLGLNQANLSGNYTGSRALVLASGAFSDIQFVSLAGGHSYDVTADDGAFGPASVGLPFAFDCSTFRNSDALNFDDSAESALSARIFAGAGTYHLSTGAGDDVFFFGGAFDAADTLDGGAGNDALVLNGEFAHPGLDSNYWGSHSVAFQAGQLSSIETLALAGGYRYAITTGDGAVAADQTLTVEANGYSPKDGATDIAALGAGDSLVFDGSGEADGHFVFDAGAGTYKLTGGLQSDTFNFEGTFSASDRIAGGGGADTLVLDGDYSAGLTLAGVTGIGTIKLGGGFSYSLVASNANIVAGGSMTIDATAVGAGQFFGFDGSAEKDGGFTIVAGAGTYSLTGGARSDIFELGSTFTDADSINGGSPAGHTAFHGDFGINHVVLNGDYTGPHALHLGVDGLEDIQLVNLRPGHSYDISAVNGAFGPPSVKFPVTLTCYQLLATDTVTFDDSAESALQDRVFAGQGTYHLATGAADDLFFFGSAYGATDLLNGGAGNDTLALNSDFQYPDLNADYTGANALTIFAGQLTSVESLGLSGGFSYDITLQAGNIAPGKTLTVKADSFSVSAGGTDDIFMPAFSSGDSLTFNGSAETAGHLAFDAAAGLYDLTGGFNSDKFNFGGAFSSADMLNGGGGNDTLKLDGDYSSGLAFGAATISSVEKIVLEAGNSYALTMNDANVAAGATLVVDARSLGAGNGLIFDGAAERDGGFDLIGGAGSDALTGGSGGDTLDLRAGGDDTAQGGGGADSILVSTKGHDTLVYSAASDSTSVGFDTVSRFNFSTDSIVAPWGQVTAFSLLQGGSLSLGTFDGDLASALSSLAPHAAIIFEASSGGLAGQAFLVIDANGVSGYQAGQDLVIHLASFSHLST
ncbi:MAG TPA: calcium-binding protein [Rhizomicrobium sp.]|nr:calcium-binding protein [Rhizomicrobium sp.]